jgi:hypothetical protein
MEVSQYRNVVLKENMTDIRISTTAKEFMGRPKIQNEVLIVSKNGNSNASEVLVARKTIS